MRSVKRIVWHAIDVYAEYCEKGYSKEVARDRATRETMECYGESALMSDRMSADRPGFETFPK